MPFYKIDSEKNRIKIFFEDIPSSQTRNILKANHWRWDPQEKCWYGHANATTVKFAESICPASRGIHNHQQHEAIGSFLMGTCGKNAHWMLSPLGQLMIAGWGEIDGYDYDQSNLSPWFTLQNQIKHLIINDGITGIGKRAFFEFVNLETVKLPSSLTFIGDRAFSKCIKLHTIQLPSRLKSIGVQAFRDCSAVKEIHIPVSVTQIGEDCFRNWTTDQKIYQSVIDRKSGKLIKRLQKFNTNPSKTISEIYFEDFVTVTTNNHCVNQGHHFENIQASVMILQSDGNIKQVTIPAGYCQTCNKYFIGYWQFENIRKLGILICRIVPETYTRTSYSGNFYNDLSPESIMKQCGYSVSVKDDLTDEQRKLILIYLMESGICSKQKILSHLSWLIQSREGRMDLINAVYKWTTDRNFVDSYKMGSGRVVAMRVLRVR